MALILWQKGVISACLFQSSVPAFSCWFTTLRRKRPCKCHAFMLHTRDYEPWKTNRKGGTAEQSLPTHHRREKIQLPCCQNTSQLLLSNTNGWMTAQPPCSHPVRPPVGPGTCCRGKHAEQQQGGAGKGVETHRQHGACLGHCWELGQALCTAVSWWQPAVPLEPWIPARKPPPACAVDWDSRFVSSAPAQRCWTASPGNVLVQTGKLSVFCMQ